MQKKGKEGRCLSRRELIMSAAAGAAVISAGGLISADRSFAKSEMKYQYTKLDLLPPWHQAYGPALRTDAG